MDAEKSYHFRLSRDRAYVNLSMPAGQRVRLHTDGCKLIVVHDRLEKVEASGSAVEAGVDGNECIGRHYHGYDQQSWNTSFSNMFAPVSLS